MASVREGMDMIKVEIGARKGWIAQSSAIALVKLRINLADLI